MKTRRPRTFVVGHRGLLPLLIGLVALGTARVLADDWPQWLGPQRDGV